MKNLTKIKFGLPILAFLIGLFASVSAHAGYDRTSVTSYYAQEAGAVTYLTGQTVTTAGLTDVTSDVDAIGGMTNYAALDCVKGSTRTCIIKATIIRVGLIRIVIITWGTWVNATGVVAD